MEIVTQFQLSDIPRILPEILLIVLALLVLGSDVFENWASDPAGIEERNRSSASLTALGLGMIFIITLVQSGFVFVLPDDAPANFFTNIVRNLQAGGQVAEPILGAFATDNMTMVARLVFIGAALLTVLLTIDYQPAGHPGEFYMLIISSTAGMCLMSGATEFILAFLALEITSIPLYVLAGYFLNSKQAAEAGMKYFLFGAMSAGILLYGMSLVYGFAATNSVGGIVGNGLTQFARIGDVVQQSGQTGASMSALLVLGMLFIVGGLGYKLAVVPFHSWSPDVYQAAPTPITAFISTASKVAGFVLLFRMLTMVFPGLEGTAAFTADVPFGGWASMLGLIALVTLLWGNLAALPQTNARRLLAYSSIAHAGFILLGILAWSSPLNMDRDMGTSALLYYLVVYTLTNLGAFGTLAAISMAVGGDDIKHLNGLARRNLPLAGLLTVFIFSLAGIPPLAGFFAKFYIFMAGWQSGAEWLVIVAVIMTVVSLYYYLRLLKAVFMAEPQSDAPIPTPLATQSTLVLTAVLVLLLGVFPNVVLQVLDQVSLVAGG